RDDLVTGVQTCALPILAAQGGARHDDVGDEVDDHEHENAALAEGDEGFGDVVDRLAGREFVGQAAGHLHHGEGGDEGRDAKVGEDRKSVVEGKSGSGGG